MREPADILRLVFDAAVAAAHPTHQLARLLPPVPRGKTIVLGAGKAASQMAGALEAAWPGPLSGLVVTPYGSAARCKTIEVVEASHPVPDAAGLATARRMLDRVCDLTPDDLVIFLASGGGSSLLPAPAGTLSLDDEIALNRVLLASGAPIDALNTIRKHVSRIKGGRLAVAAHPARVVTLVVSDIPGDNPALVASGPTIADHPDRHEALRLIDQYGMSLPEAVIAHLSDDSCAAPNPDDPRLGNHQVHILASAGLSLAAAARTARELGIEPVILSDAIQGEARDIGGMHAAIAREIVLRDQPFRRPILLLSGGETTVTLKGSGRGGRNSEFMLAFALSIAGLDGVTALAADTDGIDGNQDCAGAYATGTTVARMLEIGIDAAQCLASQDSWRAFSAIGDLLKTGPTGTNVNDFRAMLIS